MDKLWSKEEELYLTENYERGRVNDICKALERSKQSVIRKAQRMELGEVRNYNKWTAAQIKYLIENFNNTSNEDIAKRLKVTSQAVNSKARKLKLKKSKEYKRKVMSEALKGNNTRLGVKHTEKTKMQISNTMKSVRGKASQKVKYRKIWNSFDEEKKDLITGKSVQAMRDFWAGLNKEERSSFVNPRRIKANKIRLQKWKNLTEEQKAKRMKPMWDAIPRQDTTIELKIKDELDKRKIKYEREKNIGRYRCDFYLPESNLVIECDGDYWHSLPKAIEKDKRKDKFLTEQGYKIARIKECEIRENASFYLEKAIKNARWS